MASREDIFHVLEPVLTLCRNLDFDDPDECESWLEEAFPFAGADTQSLLDLGRQGVAEGWLCNRGEPGARFSRVAKPDGPEQTMSLDAVLLAGAAPAHRHPAGEVDLCFATDGSPTFDGREPGWVVYGKDSAHTPRVDGGEMLIYYILPGGAIDWL